MVETDDPWILLNFDLGAKDLVARIIGSTPLLRTKQSPGLGHDH